MENSMEIPQNIKGRAIITSNNFISWYLFKENKNTNKKICMHCQVYYSFIYIGQDMKQPKCLLKDEQIKKYVYIHCNIFWP